MCTIAYRDVFAASELERAAFALAALQMNLKLLKGTEYMGYNDKVHSRTGTGSSDTNSSGNAVVTAQNAKKQQQLQHLRGVASLEKQTATTSEQLVNYITQKLILLYSNAMNGEGVSCTTTAPRNDEHVVSSPCESTNETKANQQSNVDDERHKESVLKCRSFAHCLRALNAIGCGDLAAKVLAEQVVIPLARYIRSVNDFAQFARCIWLTYSETSCNIRA